MDGVEGGVLVGRVDGFWILLELFQCVEFEFEFSPFLLRLSLKKGIKCLSRSDIGQ